MPFPLPSYKFFLTFSHSSSREVKKCKLVRQILLKYIYTCTKFLMYKMLFWQLKLVSTISIVAHKITFKKSKMLFILLKKLLLSSRFSNFCTSLFLSFFLWPLLILWKKLIDDKFLSLWHHYVPKPYFKNAGFGEVKF